MMNKILDVKKLIFRLWILLWVILFLCLIFKLLFNEWQPIIVEDENFIKICDYISKHEWLKIGIASIFYTANSHIVFLTYTKRGKYKNKLLFLISSIIFIIISIIKSFFNFIGLFFEIGMIAVAILYNLKYKKFKNKIINILMPIIVYTLLNIWQSNILLVRGLKDTLNELPFLFSIILQIDYYIFTLITWIGVINMGSWGQGWWWNKPRTELLALLKQEEAKEKPNLRFIEQLKKKNCTIR